METLKALAVTAVLVLGVLLAVSLSYVLVPIMIIIGSMMGAVFVYKLITYTGEKEEEEGEE